MIAVFRDPLQETRTYREEMEKEFKRIPEVVRYEIKCVVHEAIIPTRLLLLKISDKILLQEEARIPTLIAALKAVTAEITTTVEAATATVAMEEQGHHQTKTLVGHLLEIGAQVVAHQEVVVHQEEDNYEKDNNNFWYA